MFFWLFLVLVKSNMHIDPRQGEGKMGRERGGEEGERGRRIVRCMLLLLPPTHARTQVRKIKERSKEGKRRY